MTTSAKGHDNVMTQSGHTMFEFEPPLVVDPEQKNPHTLHYRGTGVFAVTGKAIKIPSRMR